MSINQEKIELINLLIKQLEEQTENGVGWSESYEGGYREGMQDAIKTLEEYKNKEE